MKQEIKEMAINANISTYAVVYSQEQLDEVEYTGDAGSGVIILFGTEDEPARINRPGDRRVFFVCGGAHAAAYGDARVCAYDWSRIEAHGSSVVNAYHASRVRAFDGASVLAGDESRIEAYDNSFVRAGQDSVVDAYGSARVEAEDRCRVNVRDHAAVTVSGYARVNEAGRAGADGNAKSSGFTALLRNRFARRMAADDRGALI